MFANVFCEMNNFRIKIPRQKHTKKEEKKSLTENKQVLYGDEGNKTKEFSLTAGVS